MDRPSPTPTEEFPRIVFAKLRPNNKLACQNFSAVVDEVLLGKNKHQAQFLEYKTEQVALAEAIDFTSAGAGSGFSEHETETEYESEAEDETNIKVWVGAYILSLETLPAVPTLGWRIGRFVSSTVKDTFTPRDVDLLLCPPGHSHVRGNHARLAFDRESGILRIHSRHDRPHGITLNGESFCLTSRALHKRSSTLRFGDLEYIFAYTIAANSVDERFFQADKNKYFTDILSSPPPLESTSTTPSSEDITVGEWKLHRELGRGAYGSVSAASHSTGKIVAFKSLLRYNEPSARAVNTEIEMAELITGLLGDDDHHIIRLVQVLYQRGNREYDHENPENIWILYTPLVQGTIGDIFSKKNHDIGESTRVLAFQQLLQGLQWLHAHRLVHRDIKPPNIGVSLGPLRVSILDLGSVGKLDRNTGLLAPLPGCLGTVHYLAPEMDLSHYNEKVDIWASGIVGCEIILGYHPWPLSVNPWRSDTNPKLHEYKAHHTQVLKSLEREEGKPKITSVRRLIANMLKWDPKERPTSQNALTYPCFSDQGEHGRQKRRKN